MYYLTLGTYEKAMNMPITGTNG